MTLFGIFLTPVFFYVIQKFGGVKQERSGFPAASQPEVETMTTPR